MRRRRGPRVTVEGPGGSVIEADVHAIDWAKFYCVNERSTLEAMLQRIDELENALSGARVWVAGWGCDYATCEDFAARDEDLARIDELLNGDAVP